MHEFLLELLQCPSCRGDLSWTIIMRDSYRILEGLACCDSCGATYPVRDGIAIFLTPDLPREDLWESQGSYISRYLADHPEVEERLLDSPLESLAPADKFFRAMILEERGKFHEAEEAYCVADLEIYTAEYREGRELEFQFVLDKVSRLDGIILDLASGRGALAQAMLQELAGRDVIVTDFSPQVLRQDQRRFKWLGLDDHANFIAFDARKMPFKGNSLPIVTTNVGLQNIRDGIATLKELARVISGRFMAISLFGQEDDLATVEFLYKNGLADFGTRSKALNSFKKLGWNFSVQNAIRVRALPTPKSALIEGAGIDAIPLTETVLEWCTMVAEPAAKG